MIYNIPIKVSTTGYVTVESGSKQEAYNIINEMLPEDVVQVAEIQDNFYLEEILWQIE